MLTLCCLCVLSHAPTRDSHDMPVLLCICWHSAKSTLHPAHSTRCGIQLARERLMRLCEDNLAAFASSA